MTDSPPNPLSAPSASERHGRLLSDTLLYGAARIGTQLTGIVGLAVFAFWLDDSDFGAYTLLLTVSGFAVSTFSTVFATGIIPLYFGFPSEKRPGFLGTARLLAAFTALGGCAILALAALPLSRAVLGTRGFAAEWAVFTVLIFSMATAQSPFQVLRLRNLTAAFAGWNLALGALPLAAGAVALYVADGSLMAMLTAQGIAGLVVLAGCWVATNRDAPTRMDSSSIGPMLRFGLPLVPVIAFNWVLSSLDRIVLGHQAGLEAAGIYAVGVTVARLIDLVVNSANMAWAPYFLAHVSEPGFTRRVRTPLTLFGMFAMGVWFAVAILGQELAILVKRGMPADVSLVVAIVGLGSTALVLYYVWVNVLYRENRTVRVAVNMAIAAATHVVLTLVLVRSAGSTGAAMAVLASTIVLVVLCGLAAKRAAEAALIRGGWLAAATAWAIGAYVIIWRTGLLTEGTILVKIVAIMGGWLGLAAIGWLSVRTDRAGVAAS